MPADKLAGRQAEIFAARDRKLAERESRKTQRETMRLQAVAEGKKHATMNFRLGGG